MGAIFDFTSREKSEKIMRESWEEFRNALARGEFSYDETDKAMATTFLRVFDNMFQYDGVKELLTKRFKDIRTGEFDLGRGTRLRPEEMTASYDRIMPCSRFITNDNRFSPPGVEWLYLSLGDKNEDGSSNSKEIAQKESNEGVSVLRNSSKLGLPIPEKLKAVLSQMHDKPTIPKNDNTTDEGDGK